MRNHQLFLLSVILILNGCIGDANSDQFDKSLVTSIEKLNSPDNSYSFYKYYVETSMAFGDGTIRMSILKNPEKLNYSNSEFFTIEGYGPVVLGWTNQRTIKIIALSSAGGVSGKEPFRHETKKWNDCNIEIDYYHMFSTGRNPFRFNSYTIKGDTITFANKREHKSFVKGKVEMSFDSSIFNIREVEAIIDSTGKKVGRGKVFVSSNCWELTSTKPFDFSKFISSGVLIKQK